jgi:hypothetical protein
MINEMKTFMEKVLTAKGFDAHTSLLKFGNGNQKLGDIITFSMPAGHSCPFAKDCRSCATLKATRTTNNKEALQSKPCGFGIQDGPQTKFRCYTAIDEVLRPAVREARWHNFLLVMAACRRGIPAVVELIESSLPPAQWNKPTRIHVAGDFFNQTYFDAWLKIALKNPTRIFYAYTKALPLWVKRLEQMPPNFKLTASRGGTHDYMIEKYNLRSATVVSSVEEAQNLGLPLDHDDSHAYGDGGSFALLVHGQQPAGSPFAKAWRKLIAVGMGGYGKQKIIRTKLGAKTVSAGYFS